MVALSEVKAILPQADPHHPAATGAGAGAGARTARPPRGRRRPGPLSGRWRGSVGPASCSAAAERLRAAGYRRFDTYSPFPVHGMDRAIGLGRSKVPLFTLAGGIFGLASPSGSSGSRAPSAYRLVTGGKPLNSTEAFVPITFETMILYAAFGSVAGMLLLNGLPRLYHPVFRGRSFARVTDDGFFLTVEARDPKFDPRETPARLAAAGGPRSSCWTRESDRCAVGMFAAGCPRISERDGWRRCVGSCWGSRLVAAVVVSLMGPRGAVSDRRPLMLISDMDFQPRYNAQAASPVLRRRSGHADASRRDRPLRRRRLRQRRRLAPSEPRLPQG